MSLRKAFKRLLGLLLGFFPTRAPIGIKEFNDFCDQIFYLYDIPDNQTYRVAIATTIMHNSDLKNYRRSMYWYYKSMRFAQGNEVAYQIIADDRDARNKVDREAKQAAYDAKMAAIMEAESKPAVTVPTLVSLAENQG